MPGRAPLRIPVDPWEGDALEKLRNRMVTEAAKMDVDLVANPRALLAEPDLCKILWPGVDKFFCDDEAMQDNIRQFVSELVAKRRELAFPRCVGVCKEARGV